MFRSIAVAAEETPQFWCLGNLANGDDRVVVRHTNDKGVRKPSKLARSGA